MSVNGDAAAETMLNYGYWRCGYCLECVWQAYADNGARSDGKYYPTAYSAWTQTDPARRHEGDTNPPSGVPVYWGPKSSSSAGDIVISLGGGMVVATDVDGNGRIGKMSIADRGRQIGRPYLGWTETILGDQINYAGNTPNPLPIGDDDMGLFVAIVPKTSGGTKSFLCAPSANGKLPYFGIVLQGQSNVSSLPTYYATEDWAYSALTGSVSGINKN